MVFKQQLCKSQFSLQQFSALCVAEVLAPVAPSAWEGMFGGFASIVSPGDKAQNIHTFISAKPAASWGA